MASGFKLTYFDISGLAQPIRHLFALAKVDFEDEKIPMDLTNRGLDPNLKSTLPWGQLPVLHSKGELILSQSKSIMRFVARKYEFAGSSDLESAKIDEYVDALDDFFSNSSRYFRMKTKEEKTENLEESKKLMQVLLGRFEKIISNKEGPWLIGKSEKPTWADAFFCHVLRMFEWIFDISVKNEHTNVCKLYEAYFNIFEIKEWEQKFPFKIPRAKDFE